MRITVFLLLFSVVQVMGESSYSQNTRLSLNLKNVSIEKVLDEIENQSEFYFLFNQKLVNVDRKIDINVKNKRIKDILGNLFPDSDVNYMVIDHQILLSPQNLQIKDTQRYKQPQGIIVTGKVTDEDGNPLPGVNIVIKGTLAGTITDADGSYSIDVDDPDATLVFSFIGYQEKIVELNGRQEINVALQQSITELEEVITIGYGRQKKKIIVGSVASVKGDMLVETASSDITNAISGRLPGLTVMQPTGEPGKNTANIQVRGRTTLHGTTPLVVIDGIPGRSMVELDPVDIEDITLLKDAAASIYGATAANGVILITTKRGESEKPRLQIDSYQGFSTPTIVPEICDAAEYATLVSEYQIYEGRERSFSDEDIELFRSGKDPWEHPNTHWMDLLIADWTTRSKHSMTLDGTLKSIGYYFSFGYKNEEAIYEQESTSYNQYNTRAKLDIPVTDWMKVSYDFAGFRTYRTYPAVDVNWIYSDATKLAPTTQGVWPNGKPGLSHPEGKNPVVVSSFKTGHDDKTNYIMENTFGLNLTPIENLSIEGRYSFDIDNQYHMYFRNPWLLYKGDWDTAEDTDGDGFIDNMELIPVQVGAEAPKMQENYNRGLLKMIFANIRYMINFGNHQISFFGALEQLNNDKNSFGGFRTYYISDKVQTLSAGGEGEKDNWGERWIYARRSYIGRLSYNYKEKYLAEISIRRDGSLKYSPDNRWGNFPSVMLGWRASEEDFWQENLSFINYFKLRASYGKLGMDPGSPYQYLNKYVISNGMAFGTDKTVETTVSQESFANTNITWEKEDVFNVGFESQFLDNTFNLEADFFYKKRYDILIYRNASIPRFTGLALPQENLAEVDNRGLEIIGGYKTVFGKDFRLYLSGNISYNKNTVVYMDEPEKSVPWQELEGNSYGVKLMYQSIGVFVDEEQVESYPHWSGAKAGDIILEDVDGDNDIDKDDQILFEGTDSPRTFYGISLDLSYKNWNFSMLVQGQGKFYRRHTPSYYRGEGSNYLKWHYDNRWTQGDLPGIEKNINTDVPRVWSFQDQYWQVNNNTYWYDNMAYCRLKNVVLSYQIPTKVFGSRIGISSARVFVRGNNLFLIYSAQHNFDPEVGNPLIYPPTRTIATGINVTF
jgi:TonB-linked SusC/RagA family outer membrane protein